MRWRMTAEIVLNSTGTHDRSTEIEADELDELLDSDQGEDLLEDFKDVEKEDIRKLSIILERLPDA